MKTKFLCTLALLLSITTSIFATDNSFASLFPENTSIYFEFNNTAATNSDFGQTALSQMINDPQSERFISHTKKKLDEIFTMAALMAQGIQPRDLMSAFGNHVALGFFLNGKHPEFLLILEFPEETDPVKLLATMNPAGPNAKEFSLTLPLNPSDPGQTLFLRVVGQRLYTSIGSNMNSVNSAINTRITSLGSSPDYLRASSQLGSNRLITAYTTPDLLDLTNAVGQKVDMEEGELDFINKNLITTLAFGMCIEAPAFVQRYYVKEATIYTPYQLLTAPDFSQISFVATDTPAFATIGVKLEQAVGFALEALILSVPESADLTSEQAIEALNLLKDDVMNAMIEVEAEYGINPITDIVENLGTGFTFCMQNTDNLPGLSLFGYGGATLIAKAKDPAKLDASLNLALDTAIPMLEDYVASKLEIHTEFGTIKGLAFANSFTFCYLITGDTVILALNPAAIESTLARREAKQNLLSSDGFTSLKTIISATASKTGISTEPVMIGGLDIDGITDLVNNTLALGASIGGISYASEAAAKVRAVYDGELPFSPIPNPTLNPPAFIKFLSEGLPLYLLPSKNTINQYIFDAWAAAFITTEGELVSISYGPFPLNNVPFSKIHGFTAELSKFIAIGAAAASDEDLLEEMQQEMIPE